MPAMDERLHTRHPESELMDLPHEVEAYAQADFASVNQAFVNRLVDVVRKPDARALDLGTGPGDIPLRIKQLAPNWQITAVDGAPAMLDLARQAQKRLGLTGIEWCLADAKATGLPGGTFDVVCSNSIIHHVGDIGAFWREVRRLTKPGGWIFMRDLFRPATLQAAREITRHHAGTESPILQQEFFRSLLAAYTPQEVQKQLQDAGLTTLQVLAVTDRHMDVWGRLAE